MVSESSENKNYAHQKGDLETLLKTSTLTMFSPILGITYLGAKIGDYFVKKDSPAEVNEQGFIQNWKEVDSKKVKRWSANGVGGLTGGLFTIPVNDYLVNNFGGVELPVVSYEVFSPLAYITNLF